MREPVASAGSCKSAYVGEQVSDKRQLVEAVGRFPAELSVGRWFGRKDYAETA